MFIFIPVSHAMPHQVIERERFVEPDLLLPVPVSFAYGGLTFCATQNFVFRVQDFHGQLSVAGMSRAIRKGHVQNPACVSHNGWIISSCLERFHNHHCYARQQQG
jgi:hypothetical protein